MIPFDAKAVDMGIAQKRYNNHGSFYFMFTLEREKPFTLYRSQDALIDLFVILDVASQIRGGYSL